MTKTKKDLEIEIGSLKSKIAGYDVIVENLEEQCDNLDIVVANIAKQRDYYENVIVVNSRFYAKQLRKYKLFAGLFSFIVPLLILLLVA